MGPTESQLDLLLDLEARHDDLLRRLEELDKRVEGVLAEWQPTRQPEGLSSRDEGMGSDRVRPAA